MFGNIPEELKAYRQFVCWKSQTIEGKNKKIPISPLTGEMASVTDAATWSNFNHAVHAVATFKANGIGFVLTGEDPYTFIDLDKPKSPEEVQAQLNIYERFNSYSEISPSGTGLHIVVRGSVPTGVRNGSIELYSSARYMTLTGNVYNPVGIADSQVLLTELYNELAKRKLGNEPSLETIASYAPSLLAPPPYREACETVWKAASSAYNHKLFEQLWAGEWRGLYPSQSEADQALMNILAFYTKDLDVLRGMFLQSALGQRPKALRNDYLNRTIRLALDNVTPPVDIIASNELFTERCETSTSSEDIPSISDDITFKRKRIQDLPSLPGLVHDIAIDMYRTSRNQCAEFALTGAIGLVAGISGRAFNIQRNGLNLYMLLLAQTGMGKDSVLSSINAFVNAVSGYVPDYTLSQSPQMIDANSIPSIRNYVSNERFASGQGFRRAITAKPSCVFVQDEYGKELARLTDERASASTRDITDTLLALYTLSCQGRELGGTTYADTKNNTQPIKSPAVSVLGLSTPESALNAINDTNICDGFLPRMLILTVNDDPVYNPEYYQHHLTPSTISNLATLVNRAQALNSRDSVQQIELTADAYLLYEQHRCWCRNKIKSSNAGNGVQHLWNRANQNSIRLAGLLAVGSAVTEISGTNKEIIPIVTLEQMQWAIDFVNCCVFGMVDRFDMYAGLNSDDVIGSHDTKCLAYIQTLLKNYSNPRKKCPSRRCNTDHRKAGVISYHYLFSCAAQITSFAKAARGPLARYVREVLDNLVRDGTLIPIDAATASATYNSRSVLYLVNKEQLR
jgi:hypothetical protein